MVAEHVIDTSALIELHKEAREPLAHSLKEKGTVVLSIITLYEYLFGEAYLGKDITPIKKSLERLYAQQSLDQKILLKTLELDVELTKRGKRLQLRDLIIGATALVRDATLVTEDTEHFARLKEYGLRYKTLSEMEE